MHKGNPDKKSEDTQSASVDRTVEIGLNTRENYGLNFPMFAGRAGKEQILTEHQVRLLSIGFYNMTLPDQLLKSLNPHEILATLFGVGKIKFENKYYECWYNLSESCGKQDAYRVIDAVVNKIAWHEHRGIPQFLGMLKKRRYNPHDDRPHMLEARINTLSPQTKKLIVNRFKITPLFPGTHYEDRQFESNDRIRAYAGDLTRSIRNLYRRNNPDQAASDSPQSKNT
ncbi:hypothetical protein KY310_00530 [Candidatus Woesearchaeota archaeon]|nr:hypothetical protein [Candidatus Woesearchaeota archaeon]